MNTEKKIHVQEYQEQHVIFRYTHLHLTSSFSLMKAHRSVTTCDYFLSRKGQTQMLTH
jgi:hypothetical protein